MTNHGCAAVGCRLKEQEELGVGSQHAFAHSEQRVQTCVAIGFACGRRAAMQYPFITYSLTTYPRLVTCGVHKEGNAVRLYDDTEFPYPEHATTW